MKNFSIVFVLSFLMAGLSHAQDYPKSLAEFDSWSLRELSGNWRVKKVSSSAKKYPIKDDSMKEISVPLDNEVLKQSIYIVDGNRLCRGAEENNCEDIELGTRGNIFFTDQNYSCASRINIGVKATDSRRWSELNFGKTPDGFDSCVEEYFEDFILSYVLIETNDGFFFHENYRYLSVVLDKFEERELLGLETSDDNFLIITLERIINP